MKETSMLPAEFEPTLIEIERPHILALDRAATGIAVFKEGTGNCFVLLTDTSRKVRI
jgi:hypothetical protein